jgi:uncharacterized protein YbjT (DUF2867 family)
MHRPLLLITGATGNQGGATVRAILRHHPARWRLRALVRNRNTPKAALLSAAGVELAQGDLNDEASLQRALEGVYGVHAVQTPMEEGPEGEERQGRLLASVAAEAGVRHFVYSSAGGVERNSGVPHFESKRAVERHIEGLGLPATILRPAAFMENFGAFAFRTTMLSMMKTYLHPDQRLQLVSTQDVGWFAASAFADPDEYLGKAIEIAGDAVTRAEAVATLRHAGVKPALGFTIPGPLRKKLPADFRLMFEWMAREGFQANVPALRRQHPGLLTLHHWTQNGSAPEMSVASKTEVQA